MNVDMKTMQVNNETKEVSHSLVGLSNGNTIRESNNSKRNRARIWFFTLNNYTEEEVVSLSHNKWDDMKINLYVFQKEIGENGTKHLQGVVQFNNQISFSSLKEFNKRIHWQKCKGIKNSIKYCSKENTRDGKDAIYTYGDVEKYLWKDKAKNTLTMDEIIEDMRRQAIESISKKLNPEVLTFGDLGGYGDKG